MPEFTVPAADGTHFNLTENSQSIHHDLAIRTSGGAAVGTVVVTGRKAGCEVYEEIPDATIDLAALHTVQFIGSVAEYKIVITGLSGVTSIVVTDNTATGV